KACALPENPAGYRHARPESDLFNKALSDFLSRLLMHQRQVIEISLLTYLKDRFKLNCVH
ncbi:hypothetical protein, partial [Pantoea dispersa]|uniref:hypothetical protein n=1 Tax=Pantoea dispersa TaxID=59814 RepID=UPI001C8B0D7A